MPDMKRKTVEVVVKVTERCNINCSYCYVFNKGDEGYKDHPVYMSQETIAALGDFLNDAAKSMGATEVIVVFHGGEPLMMKKRRFDQMCKTLQSKIIDVATLRFSLQTNAMLIDQEWIDIFDRYQISIGVSLDGPREVNDAQRIDHQGQGTYDRVVQGLQQLRQARDEGLITGFGVLSVANPALDGRKVYRHFVDDLKLDGFDFLLPIDPHDGFDTSTVPGYGRFLCEVFDEWSKDDDPTITVRILNKAMNGLSETKQNMVGMQDAFAGDHAIFTVASNGDLGPDDTLRTVGAAMFGTYNVRTSTFMEFMQSPMQAAIVRAETTLPDDCQGCAWQNICRGGASNGRLINRFKQGAGFNNASLMCDALQRLYSHVAAYLLKAGFPYEKLRAGLTESDLQWNAYEQPCDFSRQGKLYSALARKTIPIAALAVTAD
ncbi:MAG: radical SAM protein [Betaproteobacteria bacterium]|nr:radical SAM protein [Betaproteobacteria bacterium]